MLLYCAPVSISAVQCSAVPWDVRQAAPYVYTIYKAKGVQLTDELTILTNSQLTIYQRVTSFLWCINIHYMYKD